MSDSCNISYALTSTPTVPKMIQSSTTNDVNSTNDVNNKNNRRTSRTMNEEVTVADLIQNLGNVDVSAAN